MVLFQDYFKKRVPNDVAYNAALHFANWEVGMADTRPSGIDLPMAIRCEMLGYRVLPEGFKKAILDTLTNDTIEGFRRFNSLQRLCNAVKWKNPFTVETASEKEKEIVRKFQKEIKDNIEKTKLMLSDEDKKFINEGKFV